MESTIERRERRVAALLVARARNAGRDLAAELRIAELDDTRSPSTVRIHRYARDLLAAR